MTEQIDRDTEKTCNTIIALMSARLTNCEGSATYDEVSRSYELIIRSGEHYAADRLLAEGVHGMLRTNDTHYMNMIIASLASRLGRQMFVKGGQS